LVAWLPHCQHHLLEYCCANSSMVPLLQDALQGPFSVLCCTWNVGNANPPDDLSTWLERPQQCVLQRVQIPILWHPLDLAAAVQSCCMCLHHVDERAWRSLSLKQPVIQLSIQWKVRDIG
jgi:hypothetical protein